LLNNDKVLVVGGNNYLWATELYDQGTGTFSQTGDLSEVRQYGHTATRLLNGKVLITGGINVDYHTTNKAELYDPTTGTFSVTGDMHYARVGHTATLLSNGKVLIAGGSQDGLGGVQTSEIYDPATGGFSLTGQMHYARGYHQAILLSNNNVLLLGGGKTNANDPDPGTTVELYEPSSGSFSLVGNLNEKMIYHTATLLPNGKILIAGGYNDNGLISQAELYNPGTNTATFTGSLINLRSNHTATLLPNGKVFIVGGRNGNDYLTSSELYDFNSGVFVPTGPMNIGRADHAVALLTNGKVLVAGGGDPANTAELYDPTNSMLTPVADSYIKQGAQNENEGASTFLRLQQSGHNRALIKFDESQIQDAVGNSQNYTAKLRLTITDNGNNWGTNGRSIEIHRMTQDWVEGNGFITGNSPANRGTGSGATWNCAVDSNISNQSSNCLLNSWSMSVSLLWPFASAATYSTTITNNQTGLVELDVTSDVQSFLNNTNQNYGWLIKKGNEEANGRIEFGSKESGNSPQLIITNNSR
jgi:hypothetical protein